MEKEKNKRNEVKNTKLFNQSSYNNDQWAGPEENPRLQKAAEISPDFYKIQLVIHISTQSHPSSVYFAEFHKFSCQNPNSEENVKKYADSITAFQYGVFIHNHK